MSSPTRLFLVGTGGHARSVLEVAAHRFSREQVVLLDDAVPAGTRVELGVVQGDAEWCLAACTEDDWFFVAVGHGALREAVVHRLAGCRARPCTLIDPRAIVATDAVVGPGSVVMPGAVLRTGVRLGQHCIVNTGAILDHECEVEDFAGVSPAAAIGGNVRIARGAFVGIGACVAHRLEIGPYAVVGAGSTVLDDVATGTLTAGSPARVVRHVPRDYRYV